MSEGALDLSISSYDVSAQRHSSRTHDPLSSDSGRASSDSTSSEIHEDIKSRYRTSPPPRLLSSPSSGALPPPQSNSGVGISSPLDPSSIVNSNNNTHHLGPSPHSPRSPLSFPPSPARLRNPIPPTQPPLAQQQQQPTALSPQHPHSTFSNNARSASPIIPRACDSGRLSNPNSPEASASSSLQEEDLKSLPLSSHPDRAGSDPRVAPIRPFKMYPVDAFNVYNSQLLSGSGGGLSPSPVGIQSLYDSTSSSSFPSFPLTPLTSHLLQRKRRAELRDNANNPISGSVKSESGSPVTTVNSSSPVFGSTGVSTTLTAKELSSKRDGSCSSDGQENELDPEKKAKIVPDEKKDDAYWDRRRKNNEAAKRSRDARRQKEEEIAMRAAFLEQENLKLRAQVAILKNETAKLHYMLYNRI